MNSKHKNTLIIVLLAIVLIMAVGYAAFAQLLTIKGSAEVVNSWDVKITDISLKSSTGSNSNPVGLAENPSTLPESEITNPTHTDTTATFYSTIKVPGDSITYTVTIVNNGSVDARVDTIKWVDDYGNDDLQYNISPIIYSYSFPGRNEILRKNGGTTTLDVTVTYDDTVTSQPQSGLEKSATISINYVQA